MFGGRIYIVRSLVKDYKKETPWRKGEKREGIYLDRGREGAQDVITQVGNWMHL